MYHNKMKRAAIMSIRYIKDQQMFVLMTQNTKYAFDVYLGRFLRHRYYGKRTMPIPEAKHDTAPLSAYLAGTQQSDSPDLLLQECSFFGSGDYRASSLGLTGADGTGVTDFVYQSYRIFKGRRHLDGLPAARADEKTDTLEITMYDALNACTLKLYYTVFPKENVISRYMVLENRGSADVTIDRCMPMMLEIDRFDLDMVSLHGKHESECTYQRFPVHHGIQSTFSRRGASSPQHNPFLALCAHNATEEKGDVYGFNFVYSGSFLNEVEVDQLNRTRVVMGLGSEYFSYTVAPNEQFCSPEAVMTFSASGFGTMSRNFHNFIRAHILPPVSVEQPHPVVLNTWEAVVFKINEDLLLNFAEESHRLGVDMLVLDDGWFGARTNDWTGLGDWFANPNIFPNGLGSFVKKIKEKGVKFGIWIEPEMVNPDSDLYRAHPEWCLHAAGRDFHYCRSQLVLDMANPEVIDYLMASFDKTFGDADIDYFKWDMNRHMCDVGSTALPPEKQKELPFRYMKNVYRLLDWFHTRFPNAVIETCASGGGRYDLGMMCHGFQIWTSDNTKPNARTAIQANALIAYPAATMSCHVNNPRDSMKGLDYRYKVAVGGMLGYELNILKMTDEIKDEIAREIKEYKAFEHLMRLGVYYNLAFHTKYDYSAYYYVSPARDEMLLSVIEKADGKADRTKLLKLKEAIADATYTDLRTGAQYRGEELRRGLRVELSKEPDTAHLLHLKKN